MTGSVEQPHPLYRVGLLLRPVDELHRPAGDEPAAVLAGVARVWASHDEPVPFVLDPGGVVEPLRPPELRLVWQPQRDGRTWTLSTPDPRVDEVLDRLATGRRLSAVGGDPVVILAAEVRRMRAQP